MKAPEHFSQRRVLVTGATGFLGSHLCRRLCESGAEVHAVSRGSHSGDSVSLHWWQADLTDLEAVRKLISATQPEVIFHLSGQVTAAPDRDLVLPTFHSLLASTVDLLTVAAKISCQRVVMTGSLTEPQGTADVVPSSPYSAAKWAGSAYGRMFHKLYGTPVVIARPFMTYGPGQNVRKLIPYVILSLLQGEAPKLSSGEWQADWIYVDDVIEGLLAAAQRPDVEGSTIDLGSGKLVRVRTVVEMLADLIGSSIRPLFSVLPERPMEEVRTADTASAYQKLNWKPLTSLEAGLKSTIEWYREALAELRAQALMPR